MLLRENSKIKVSKQNFLHISKRNFCYEIWLLSVMLCSTRFLNLQGDITGIM